MDETQAKRIIEALLFVAGQAIAFKRITEALPDLDPATIRRLIDALGAEYASTGRAFHIQEVAGGYQLVTDQRLAPWIKRALAHQKPDAVSQAALETLAIIAYRQPITKAEVELIRGVDVSGSLDTLIERGFVKVAGRKDSPGRPYLYGTTAEFLRHFGLKSLEALPSLLSQEAAASVASVAAEGPAKAPAESAAEPESPAAIEQAAAPIGTAGRPT